MEQAIRDVADDLQERNISEEKARDIYHINDRNYRNTVNHKTRRGSTELYIRREGCALYLKERYGAEISYGNSTSCTTTRVDMK